MKTCKFIAAMVAVLLPLAIVSCGTKEEPEKTPEPIGEFTGSFSIVNSDGSTFSMEDIRAGYEVGEGVVDITLYGVSFSPRMPMTLDMTIPGVAVSKAPDGYSLSSASITPVALGKPFPNYMVTDLSGSLTDDLLTLKMDIGGCPSTYSGR